MKMSKYVEQFVHSRMRRHAGLRPREKMVQRSLQLRSLN